ncbi:hypothetical protein [Enhygromyxa salina]|nr:hypothetical protein [Enhygromyxa salina]
MDDGACDEPGPPPFGPFAGRTTEELFLSDAEAMALCADIAEGPEGTFKLSDDYVFGDLHIYIEHPAEFDGGPLPDGQFPLLIFEHGTGQITGGYQHIWGRIVPNGIVVANIDGPLGSNAASRGARMACIARWFALEWEHSASLNCDLGIAGQSSGGEGAFLATRYLAEHPLSPEGMFRQRVAIGIAPRQVDGDRYLSADLSVPLVVFQGSIDNDVPGGAIRNYDLMSPEELGIEGSADKYVLWMYDVEHEAFGGGPLQDGNNVKVSQEEVYAGIPEAEAEKKGAALAAEYMDAATGYFLLGRSADRDVLTGEIVPGPVLVSEWWDYLPANPDGRPMIFSAFAPSTKTTDRRIVVDTMGRVALGQITPSSEGLPVVVSGFAAPVTAVQQDWADVFTGDPGNRGHTTQVLQIAWQDEDGDVAWDVSALDLSEATHLSFRVANAIDVVEVDTGMGAECVENESPVMDLRFTIEMESGSGEMVAFDELGLIPAQDYYSVMDAYGQSRFCSHRTFMKTVRIPLSEFCPTINPRQISVLRMHFGPSFGSVDGRIILDTVEFQDDPSTPPGCP